MKLSTRSIYILAVFAAVIIAVAGVGCSAKVKSPAIGNWRGEDGKQTMEFLRDGTLRGIDEYGRPLSGSFEFIDSQHIRIKITSTSVDRQSGVKMVDNAEGICRLDVKGDSLTLTEENGTANHYSRNR